MYLMKTAGYPFTAADVRQFLGFDDTRFDLLIEAGIASICNMSRKPVRAQTLAIPVGEPRDYERYGMPIHITGPVMLGNGDPRQHMLCSYAPDPEAVRAALLHTVEWTRKQCDIEAFITAATLAETAQLGADAADRKGAL